VNQQPGGDGHRRGVVVFRMGLRRGDWLGHGCQS
jgi:hypothetical protein